MGARDLGTTMAAQAQVGEAMVTVQASIYARLVATADLAPLDGLPIPPEFLMRAATLGYTHIKHVRLVSPEKLVEDLGAEATLSIRAALVAFGLAELR